MWGATFPAGKLALDHLPALAFMAWTRCLGAVTIAALIPLLRRSDRGDQDSVRSFLGPSVLLGALIFGGYVLQTEGLSRTTATNAGFITGLYVVLTPILAAAVFRQRVPAAAWLAVAVSAIGLALLSIRELDHVHLYAGDLLVLGGAVVWAGHVIGVGHFSPRFSAWKLSLGQMTATALLQLIAVAAVGLRPHAAIRADVWPLLIITGVIGSGIAYTLQVIGQQRMTATRAVVILAGEALFAALFAAIWIGERLSAHQWVGAVLVLAAMAFSELAARRPAASYLEPASAP
jgi:drug/metabolite transporter (DMT)-like permease